MQPHLSGAPTSAFEFNDVPVASSVLDASEGDCVAIPFHRGTSFSRALGEGTASPRPEASLCFACVGRTTADARYVDYAFATPRRLQHTAESIADAMGYCALHARALIQRTDIAGPLACALRDALERWIEMLSDEAKFGDRIGEIFFNAERHCPACKFAERGAASLVTSLGRAVVDGPTLDACERLDRLCFAHFRYLYVDAAPPAREWLLAHYRETLDRLHERETQACTATDASERDLRGLLNSVAGEAGATVLESASSEFGVRDLPGSSGLSVVDSEDVCLICANVNAVRRRWLQALRPALQAGQSAWLALPSCAEHVIAAAAVGDTGVTRAAAEHAAEIALLILHRRLPPFTPAIATELERFAVRRMRRRGRKGASTRSNPRPPRRQSVRCAACERLAIARDAASARLLDALASSAGQQAKYANLCLCLRHFASVYLLADRGTTRTFLTNVQRGCLALARDRLNPNVTGDASAANASLIGALTRLGCHLSGGGAE